jgi:S-adenosylmethionine hydrolase
LGLKPSGIITLTTDFGLKDPYVGVMKGVILSIHPDARPIDLTHRVKAGSVVQASALIQEAYPYFSKGTVHVGVVDPGVGSDRRPIVVETKDHFFVGPDNGLLWPIIAVNPPAKVVHLTERKYFLPQVSQTFHGRDIFAPVAAYLSRGVDPSMMGPPIGDPVQLHLPRPRQKGDVLWGQVFRVDRFGNLITNIQRKDLDRYLASAQPIIKVGDLVVESVHQTYAEVKAGEVLALIGSSGCLEIAVNLGRASERVEGDSGDFFGMEVMVNKKKG